MAYELKEGCLMMFEKDFLNGCEVNDIEVVDDKRGIVEADVTVCGDYPGKAEDIQDGIELMLNVLLCPIEYYADIKYIDANTDNLLNYEIIHNRKEYDNLLSFVSDYAAVCGNNDAIAILARRSA